MASKGISFSHDFACQASFEGDSAVQSTLAKNDLWINFEHLYLQKFLVHVPDPSQVTQNIFIASRL